MKIALCGLWHVHAPGYLRTAAEYAEIVGVYDENEQWRKDFCEKNNVREFATFQELVDSDAEGVIVCSASNRHADMIVALADAGKNIFTEKVLALNDSDCLRVEEAIKRNHVQFVISFPQKYVADRAAVHDLAASGELGTINYMRFRNCHAGSIRDGLPAHFYNAEQCGGGAMVDLGAHGMYLIDWICGRPDTYTSVFTKACHTDAMAVKNKDNLEDNAVTVMGYANGCIAVSETGFDTVGCPASLEVGGDLGYVRMDGNGVVKCTESTGMKPVKVELGENLPSPLEQFLTGKILPGCGIEEAKNLTHMMVMAYKNIV